jgi:hypothetical protein
MRDGIKDFVGRMDAAISGSIADLTKVGKVPPTVGFDIFVALDDIWCLYLGWRFCIFVTTHRVCLMVAENQDFRRIAHAVFFHYKVNGNQVT